MAFPTFKTRDEIPEAFREMYEEKDGAWHPKAEPDKTAEDVAKLKTALDKERDARAAAERAQKDAADKLAAAEREKKDQEFGIDSEKAKTWREEQYKVIRAEVQEEVDGLKKQLGESQGETRSLRLDTKVRDLALKNGVAADKIDDWWALNGSHFDLDDAGAPMVKEGKGKDVAKYIAEDLKKARGYLYEGTKAGGGGGGGGRPPVNGGDISVDALLSNPAAALESARASQAA